MTYEELRDRLSLLPEAMSLFSEMVRAHVASTGDRRFMLVVAGSGAHVIFTGFARTQIDDLDPGTLDDLVEYGLLRKEYGSRGTPTYRITGEGVLFYKWLMAQTGSPIEQTDAEVRSLIGGREFVASHPSAAHHLSEAFELLWGGDLEEKTISEVGEHLRNAVFDVTTDLIGAENTRQRERPVDEIRAWVASLGSLGERERRVMGALVELVDAVLHLDQRIKHARDEADKGIAVDDWDEVRRASFLTAVLCHELHLAATRR